MVHGNTKVCAGVIALVICAVCGCTASVRRGEPGSISSLVRASDYGLEVASTTTDQAREEILNAPTVFEVTHEEDGHSWERARFFLENYVAAGNTTAVSKLVGQTVSLASNPNRSSYQYEVSKSETRDGFTYRVSCVPLSGGDTSQAALNAGNFARFVRDGVLEVSLLQSAR